MIDNNVRVARPNEKLEAKVDETNRLLAHLLAEIKALRDNLAPKQFDLGEAKRMIEQAEKDNDAETQEWLDSMKD